METLRKIDELIVLIDQGCDCADGSCRTCQIMELLWDVREDVAARLMAQPEDGQQGAAPLH